MYKLRSRTFNSNSKSIILNTPTVYIQISLAGLISLKSFWGTKSDVLYYVLCAKPAGLISFKSFWGTKSDVLYYVLCAKPAGLIRMAYYNIYGSLRLGAEE